MARYLTGFSDMYHKYVYAALVNTVSRLFSFVPFSVYEMILCVFSIYILYRIVNYIYLKINKKISFKQIIINSLNNILLYISIFAFFNMIGQGVNSFRTDFVTITDLKVEKVSEEKLTEVCNYLKDNLNELDGKINKDQNGILKLDSNVNKEVIDSMKGVGQSYPSLQGYYPNPKPYIFSKLMSYQLLEGETTFTVEANYNNDMPRVDIPSTVCHELGHIRGFNNEDEANYISFLACIASKNYEFQYSGYLMAYSYCMNDLYKTNLDAFNKISSELSPNVKKELKNDSAYWKDYKGAISKLYDKAYDALLKAGGQEEGINSYNAVVKLIVSGYKVQFEK
jgi:hypothetical protein